MTDRKRAISVTASGVLAAALVIVLHLGSSGTASGSQSTQTIDAKKDPVAAGKALDFCEVISNCQFVKEGQITVNYDAPRILGDALYNCGQAEAEDEVAISDERSESTSIDESISVKAKLGFIGLAKASITAEVNSKQLDEVATKLKQTNTVSVAPGTIGYTTVRTPTAYLDGDAHVTDGVNLITVTNLELTYPGFGNKAINKLDWTNVHKSMTDQERHDRCAGLPPVYPTSAPGAKRHVGTNLVVWILQARGHAKRRLITGINQAVPAGTKLTLARGRAVYATGTVGKSRIVLRAGRRVPAGSYTLFLSRPHDLTMLAVTVR
jgi:hypothetical protein